MQFWKEVIRPGEYFPRGKDGKPFKVSVDRERIDHWASTLRDMVKKGNRIPVPYHHTEDAVPVTLDTTSKSTYDCAGYATDAQVSSDGGLFLMVEPASEADAENFNTKIKDVSIKTDDWLDGSGNFFKDAITHVAACFHPVVNNQKPFVPAAGLTLSLSMAQDGSMDYEEKQAGTNSLECVCELLSEHGFDVGDDVTPENFIDRLGTALRAVKSWKEKEDGAEDYETKPEGAKAQKPTPIAMSVDIIEFALQKAQTEPENPETGKAWTPEEIRAAHEAMLDAEPKLELSAEHQAALDLLQNNNKQIICDRLSDCVKSLTMPQAVAEDILSVVKETSLEFSADGTVDESKHRDIFIPLKMAEASNSGAALNGQVSLEPVKRELQLNLTTEEQPADFEAPSDELLVSEEKALENAKQLLRSIGR